MKMKKMLAWLLIFAMAFSGVALTSCGDENNNRERVEVDESDLSPAFDEEAKYYGGRFNILTVNDGSVGQYGNVHDIVADGNLGDAAIVKVVRERNQRIQDNFGTEIKRITDTNPQEKAQTAINSKSNTYDAFRFEVSKSLTVALNGGLLDLKNEATYLDLEEDWWDQGITDNLMLADGVYIAIGDLMTGDKDSTYITLFNEMLLGTKNIIPTKEGQTPSEYLYELTMDGVGQEGGLTMELLMHYAQESANAPRDASKPLWKVENQTLAGNYGFYTQRDMAKVILLAGGFTSTKKDDGELSGLKSNIDSTFADAVNEVWNYFGKVTGTAWFVDLDEHQKKEDDFWNLCARGSFKANKATFFMCHAATIDLIRDMDEDYGVLPIPKLYDTQTEYASTLQYMNCPCITVPKRSGKNLNEKSSYILEAMCYYSSQEYAGEQSLNYNYYNRVMKAKGVRDENAWGVIDLIFNNRVYDLGFALNIGKIDSGVIDAATGKNTATFNQNSYDQFDLELKNKLEVLLGS